MQGYGLISCQMVGKLRQPTTLYPTNVEKPIMVYKSVTKLAPLANRQSAIFKKLATVYGSTTQLAIVRPLHALYL